MGLGHKDPWVASHTCDLNRLGDKGHLGVHDLWFKFLKKKVTVSTYFDIFSWNLDKMILRQSHTCDLNRSGVKGHFGVIYLLVKF